MPTSSAKPVQTTAQSGEDAAYQPWLNFFREVRRLAAKLDAMEQNKTTEDGERLS